MLSDPRITYYQELLYTLTQIKNNLSSLTGSFQEEEILLSRINQLAALIYLQIEEIQHED